MSVTDCSVLPLIEKRTLSRCISVCTYGKDVQWKLQDSGTGVVDLEAVRNVLTVLDEHGAHKVYAPNPSQFNGYIADPKHDDFQWLETGPSQGTARIERGVYADGVILTRPHTAGCIMSADCPTLILAHRGTAVIAHCGRDSVLRGMKTESDVVLNALAALTSSSLDETHELDRVKAHIVLGISGNHYEHSVLHPTHGAHNKDILEYILHEDHRWGACLRGNRGEGIDMPQLVTEQLLMHGMLPENISWDGLDTFSDPWLASHAAGNERRNAVFVFKHS